MDGPFDKSRDFNPLDTAAAAALMGGRTGGSPPPGEAEAAAKVNMEIQTRNRFLSLSLSTKVSPSTMEKRSEKANVANGSGTLVHGEC